MTGSWTVNGTMDTVYCEALLDFDVPGVMNPPPVVVTATVWTLSLALPSGTFKKYVLEWTDSSGILDLPSTPLNTWVQSDHVVTTSKCIQSPQMLFKDIYDNDTKLVSISDNQKFLKITPFGSDDRLLTFVSTLTILSYFICMFVRFIAHKIHLRSMRFVPQIYM